MHVAEHLVAGGAAFIAKSDVCAAGVRSPCRRHDRQSETGKRCSKYKYWLSLRSSPILSHISFGQQIHIQLAQTSLETRPSPHKMSAGYEHVIIQCRPLIGEKARHSPGTLQVGDRQPGGEHTCISLHPGAATLLRSALQRPTLVLPSCRY